MGEGLDLTVDRDADLPLGAQLAARIRTGVREGRIGAGDRLPSVRDAARAAGVHVNTVRAVYARLEAEGVVRSEHGRGTFVSGQPAGDDPEGRRELRRQIAELEARLVRLPPPPLPSHDSAEPPLGRAALLSTEDLESVRDRLLERLDELDTQRAAVLEHLEQLGVEEAEMEETAPAPLRRTSTSLAGARVRWVGA
ncbi:MAG TPA: GntR family transcriptional regulator [Thermoleophilaceae bacterium]|nr:GntR family transcriptional regulator [Thermoleophilaceae bacterium]